jgi:hypothetical protein
MKIGRGIGRSQRYSKIPKIPKPANPWNLHESSGISTKIFKDPKGPKLFKKFQRYQRYQDRALSLYPDILTNPREFRPTFQRYQTYQRYHVAGRGNVVIIAPRDEAADFHLPVFFQAAADSAVQASVGIEAGTP